MQLLALPSICRNGKKRDTGICSLTLIPGKAMEQLMLEIVSRHMKDRMITRSSQHGFTEGLTNLITFYDEMASLVDEGRGGDIVYLNFSEAFDAVSLKILIGQLLIHRLDEQTVMWVEN